MLGEERDGQNAIPRRLCDIRPARKHHVQSAEASLTGKTEHLLTERLRLQPQLQTDYKSTQKERGIETKDSKAAERTFDRLIRQSIFPVIEDNFLLSYLRDAGTSTERVKKREQQKENQR